MPPPMDPLPTSPDDPRLDGWYHTIELAPGLVTRAVWDHRETVDQVGLPKSLKGKTALDVGTADGFWAFEMERRGAEKVVAVDLGRLGDVDLIPRHRATCAPEVLESRAWPVRFATARAMLGSKAEHRVLSVYDLSPETAGTFDVVYCGSMLIHLFNPLQALINIRSVTKEFAVIETTSFHPDPIQEQYPDRPFLWFGRLDREGNRPGHSVGYWSFTPRALCDMLIYAGFECVEPLEPFLMKRAGVDGAVPVTSVVAHVKPDPAVEGWYKSRVRPSSLVSTDYRFDRPGHALRPLWRRALSRAKRTILGA